MTWWGRLREFLGFERRPSVPPEQRRPGTDANIETPTPPVVVPAAAPELPTAPTPAVLTLAEPPAPPAIPPGPAAELPTAPTAYVLLTPAEPPAPPALPPAAAAAPLHLKARRVRTPVVIGLDFGTSCTKCVIGVRGRAFAVQFQGSQAGTKMYLLATQLWVGKDNTLALSGKGAGSWYQQLKVDLMERPDKQAPWGDTKTVTPMILTTGFIAHALRTGREWFLNSTEDFLADAEPVWEFNLGLPAKSHDDPKVRDSFRTVALAGWDLSMAEGPINIAAAANAVTRASLADFIPQSISRDSVHLVPEVAAEVVGYARSAQKREGPHLMVDVGATTVDVCLFQLSEVDTGYCYAFYGTDVRSDLGALRLHTHRRKAIDPSAAGWGLASPLDPIPASYRDYAGANGAAAEVDDWFGAETEKTVEVVAANAKKKQRSGLVVEVEKHRGLEREKAGDIRVLMCGGGSAIPLYVDAVREAGRALAPGGRTGLRLKRFNIVPGLEFPDRLEVPGLRKADFHRIAVAYGLSFTVDNIGRFIPPSEIEPEPRRHLVDFSDRYTGSEMM